MWAVIAVVGLMSTTSSAQSGGHIGPSTGAIVGGIVGGAAAVVVVVYLVIPKQKSVEGCVVAHDQGLQLTNESDHKVYTLTSAGVQLQTGTRVKLKGKSHKREFEVRKVVRQEGACSAP
jgi:hypothetical protein